MLHFTTDISTKIYQLYKTNKPLDKLTNEKNIKYKNIKKCEFCSKSFYKNNV